MVQPSSTRVLTQDKRVRDLRWFCPPSMTSIDEFNDDTIDAAYTHVYGSGAPLAGGTWVELGDALGLALAGGDSAGVFRAQMRPLSSFGGALAVGDGIMSFIRIARSTPNEIVAAAVMLADGVIFGSGQGISGMMFSADLGFGDYLPDRVVIGTRDVAGYNSSGGESATKGVAAGTYDGFVRLARVASGTWRTDYSLDGIAWITGATQAKTVTPTHVGVGGSTWGNASGATISFECLRRVSGVT